MILHPIASGLAFIAFLMSAGAGFLGSLLGSGLALVAWLVTLVIMAIDLAIFGVRALLFFCFDIIIEVTGSFTCPGLKKSHQFQWYRKLRLLLDWHVDVHRRDGFAVPRKYRCAIYLLFCSPCQRKGAAKEGLVLLISLNKVLNRCNVCGTMCCTTIVNPMIPYSH
jgi:hypothetical protein